MSEESVVKNPPTREDAYGTVKLARLHVFESLTEFAEEAEKGRDRGKTSSAKSDRWGDNWHGTDTFEEAEEMARTGWSAIAPDIDANLKENAEAFTAASPTFDVAGSMVDMGLYMSGEPEHMINYLPNTGSAPVISLITPFSYNSSVNSETVTKYGMAMVGAIESLRRQGTTVELYSVSEIHANKNECAVHVVRLCDSRNAYIADQVVFGVGHPSMLRRLEFGVMEGWPDELQRTYGVGGTYGAAEELVDLPALLGLPEDTVVFPKLGRNQNKWDQEQFNQHVMNIINGEEV